MLDALSWKIKFLLALVSVASIIGALWYVHHVIYQSGYDQCATDIAKQTQTAKDKSDANVSEVRHAAEPESKRIRETPDSRFGVGPITSDVLDRLR